MTDQTSAQRLKYFPVSFFAVTMGITGLAIGWQRAESVFGITFPFSLVLLSCAVLLFVAAGVVYLNKILRHRALVLAELGHPIQLNFFPTISISLLLLAIAFQDDAPGIAGVIWVVGTTLHLLLTLYIMGVWIYHEQFEIHHINPAWFIPVVGNVLVPIVGVPLGFIELSWFFFSFGMLFWLILFAIVFYRVLFHPALPERLTPTFFILIAPPAVGFLSYVALSGLDGVARFLLYAGLFLTLLLTTQVARFISIPFYLSWWAYSFPLAAMTVAVLTMYQLTGLIGFAIIGWILLSAVTLIVVYLVIETIRAMAGGKICVPAL